jgi:hypothetical protein
MLSAAIIFIHQRCHVPIEHVAPSSYWLYACTQFGVHRYTEARYYLLCTLFTWLNIIWAPVTMHNEQVRDRLITA